MNRLVTDREFWRFPSGVHDVTLSPQILVKTFILHLTILVLGAAPAIAQAQSSGEKSAQWQPDFDDTARFIFYAVLEGLYDDGVSNKDVDQILMKRAHQEYFHFIYSCPICTSAIWALQAYRSRPESFYSLKSQASTFGPGLSEELQKQLHSENPHERLTAINALVREWLERRIERSHLSEPARKDLLESLEKKRKKGMEALTSFRHHEHGAALGPEYYAPAYIDLDECAVCNGAVGKVMKLPSPRPK